MPRRAARSRIDVYPQVWTIECEAQPGADEPSYTTAEVPRPLITGVNPTILEILEISAYFTCTYTAATNTATVQVSTVYFEDLQPQDPRVILINREIVEQTVTESYFANESFPTSLSWGDGHGILVASDRLYIRFDTANSGVATNECVLKIAYRLKTVPLAEWVGIVQSQQ